MRLESAPVASADLLGRLPEEALPSAALFLAALLIVASRWRLRCARRRPAAAAPSGRSDLRDPHAHLDAVARASFRTTPLMNRSEHRVWEVLRGIVAGMPGHLLMAQTSLGEVLSSVGEDRQARDAYAAINSKRLDFAVFDPRGHLVCAIEHQGGGHYGGRTFLRDAVKREALRRAGVPMIEVPETFDPDQLRAQILGARVTRTTITACSHEARTQDAAPSAPAGSWRSGRTAARGPG